MGVWEVVDLAEAMPLQLWDQELPARGADFQAASDEVEEVQDFAYAYHGPPPVDEELDDDRPDVDEVVDEPPAEESTEQLHTNVAQLGEPMTVEEVDDAFDDWLR